jgi:hypothetical protein
MADRTGGEVMSIKSSDLPVSIRRKLELKKTPNPRGMNGLERAFSESRSAAKCAVIYHAIRLNLSAAHIEGERMAGCWYTPDFLGVDQGGHVCLFETKGFWREAAKVRIKVAASQYPMFRFFVVTREKGEWRFAEVLP